MIRNNGYEAGIDVPPLCYLESLWRAFYRALEWMSEGEAGAVFDHLRYYGAQQAAHVLAYLIRNDDEKKQMAGPLLVELINAHGNYRMAPIFLYAKNTGKVLLSLATCGYEKFMEAIFAPKDA